MESQGPRTLISMQVKEDGCALGSWEPDLPAPDHWGQTAGRLYVTSLSILTLEVYYRYLPLYRGYDDDQENKDPLLKSDPSHERPEGRPPNASRTERASSPARAVRRPSSPRVGAAHRRGRFLSVASPRPQDRLRHRADNVSTTVPDEGLGTDLRRTC